MQEYQEFLKNKMQRPVSQGFDVAPEALNDMLFPFQRDIVRWALKLGKAAIFSQVGTGKTAMQLEWARQVAAYSGKRVLILAPLAVSQQTIREGVKFGINHVVYRASADAIAEDDTLIITNYERIDKFEDVIPTLGGVVLDESSILKSLNGATKTRIIELFRDTVYKLACTATPAPNDHMELGNHAEFLDIMPSNEMLTRWFIHDSGRTQEWRLKGHAEADFWRWLTSWAVCITKPGDLGDGYHLDSFNLPALNIIGHFVAANDNAIEDAWANGKLFPDVAPSSTQLGKVKRQSIDDRLDECKKIVSSIGDDEPILIWCILNDEADALAAAFPEALEVRGSDSADDKTRKLLAFSDGEARILITKPSIAGFGMNWQHCNQVIFFGLDFSFESFYQAKGRNHRYGQTRDVYAHIIYAETEGNVIQTLEYKQALFEEMQSKMADSMREYGLFRDDKRLQLTSPQSDKVSGKNWTMLLGDCVERTKEIEDESIGLSIYSPPFSSLYIYSDSEADMGNCQDDDEFFQHYQYLIQTLYQKTMPGRLSIVHCADLPSFKGKDGVIGLKDFSGEIIRAYEAHGWIYHTRYTIWKNPVVEMQRTKAIGLLHKQFKKDSIMSRAGMPDYILAFRKPGDNPSPVTKNLKPGDYIGEDEPSASFNKRDSYSIEVWQRYASPVWFDIDQSRVLNHRIAKTDKDEKHICPLQLDVIARAVQLWSNEDDTVLSPFAGIGSEGYEALKLGRKFIGIELKPEYFNIACRNLAEAERQSNQVDLFSFAGVEVE